MRTMLLGHVAVALAGRRAAAYFAAAFGPPPPDTRTLAITGLSGLFLVLWAWWADRTVA
jgi:hypothetical protein